MVLSLTTHHHKTLCLFKTTVLKHTTTTRTRDGWMPRINKPTQRLSKRSIPTRRDATPGREVVRLRWLVGLTHSLEKQKKSQRTQLQMYVYSAENFTETEPMTGVMNQKCIKQKPYDTPGSRKLPLRVLEVPNEAFVLPCADG